MGNQISDEFKEGGEIFKYLGGAAVGTLSGIGSTLSGHPDFSGLKDNIDKIGQAYSGTNQEINDIYNPPTASDLQGRQVEQINQQNTQRQASALGVGHLVNNAYSGAMRGTVPPSQLMKISDPTAKMAIASSRGGVRGALNGIGQSMDLQASSSIQSAAGTVNNVTTGANGSLGVGK